MLARIKKTRTYRVDEPPPPVDRLARGFLGAGALVGPGVVSDLRVDVRGPFVGFLGIGGLGVEGCVFLREPGAVFFDAGFVEALEVRALPPADRPAALGLLWRAAGFDLN